MHVSLDIEDSKAEQFVAFLKTLDFVKINEEKSDSTLPEWQTSLLDKRLQAYHKNPKQVKDAMEVLNRIKREL